MVLLRYEVNTMIEIKLREILAKKGKTMADINKETGISKNALSQLANGVSQGIQFNTLEKLLNSLKVPVQELIVYTPELLSEAEFTFRYDETKELDITMHESIVGDSEESSFEYVDRINWIIDTFFITISIQGVKVEIQSKLDVNFVIDDKKELDIIHINIDEPSISSELLNLSIFEEQMLDSLTEFLIDLSESIFSEEIKNAANVSTVRFRGNLY